MVVLGLLLLLRIINIEAKLRCENTIRIIINFAWIIILIINIVAQLRCEKLAEDQRSRPGKKTQTALRSHHSQNYDEHPVDLFPKKLTFADSQVFAVAGIEALLNPKISTKYGGILLY